MASSLPDAFWHPSIVTALSVSSCAGDHASLAELFQRAKWTLVKAGSCAEAARVLAKRAIPVVMCDDVLPDGSWKELLNLTAAIPNSPVLVVTSRLADERLWAEVLNLGGYNVLDKPFDPSELSRVVSLASQHWTSQQPRALVARSA